MITLFVLELKAFELINCLMESVGFNKGSGIHWPFSNKVSALPHLNSFKASQEDKAKRLVSDSSFSPGFLSISTADAFDSKQKQFMAETQVLEIGNQEGYILLFVLFNLSRMIITMTDLFLIVSFWFLPYRNRSITTGKVGVILL